MIAIGRISDVSDQIRGVTYERTEARPDQAPGYVAVLRAGNIEPFGRLSTDDDLVFVPAARVAAEQRLRRHDVLIATSSGSLGVVGKAARVTEDMDAGFGAFCKVLRPRANVDPSYFAHFFQRPSYRRRISAAAAGASINNLRSRDLDDLEIPLPSLDEQRRVAAPLDKAEALQAKRKVSQDLLESLAELTLRAMFGDSRTNPMALPLKPLGELIRVKSGEGIRVSELARVGRYPVYGGNGVVGYTDRFLVDGESVVIGRVGAYCGNVHRTPERCWITDNALHVVERAPQVELPYLFAALRFARLNQYASRSGQPLISGSRIYPVEILLPSVEDQQEFARRVGAVAVAKLSAQRSDEELNALYASLGYRAFSGAL